MLTFIEACATIKSTIHAATDMVMQTMDMCIFYTCYKWALIKIAHLNNFHLAFYAYNLIYYLISTKLSSINLQSQQLATFTQWLGAQTIKLRSCTKHSNKHTLY